MAILTTPSSVQSTPEMKCPPLLPEPRSGVPWHPLLQELHQDHINFGRLLDLLDVQRRTFAAAANEGVDLDLLLDIVEYVDNYPDLIHHPREDAIYRVFVGRSVTGRRVVEPLFEEHRQLMVMTAQLRADVKQMLYGGPVRRDAFEQALANFIRAQRQHIDREEGGVFARIAEALTEDDWSCIEASLPRTADPLFGSEVQRQYRSIYAELVRPSA